MSLPALTTRPNAYNFEAHEERDLVEMLHDIDRSTLVLPVGSVTSLMLNPDTCQTTNGYGYSDVALSQLCGLLSSGLQSLVMDISGQWRKPGDDRRFFSMNAAVELFNRILRLRFDRQIDGMQVVQNIKQKTIDGIVGARYRYLSNSDFLSFVTQTYSGSYVKFLEGSLYGRQISVRYLVRNEKYAYTIRDDEYLPGFNFENSEIGGRSVRTASIITRVGTNHCAAGPYNEESGGRVVHSGRSFERRIQSMLSNMVNRVPHRHTIEGGGALLLNTNLQLGGHNHERVVKNLVTTLKRKRLNSDFAKRVIASAAARGCDDSDSIVDLLPDERKLVLGTRTGYDLFTALIREARQLPLDQRETAEQVAFALLTGKVHI